MGLMSYLATVKNINKPVKADELKNRAILTLFFNLFIP